MQYTTGEFDCGNDLKINCVRSPFQGSTEELPSGALASWIPHWNTVYRASIAPWDTADRFFASSNMPLHLSHNISESSTLGVEGLCVGIIGHGSSYMWHDLDTSFLSSIPLGYFFTSIPGLQILAKTLSAGRNWYGSLAQDSDNITADFAAYILDCHGRAEDKSRDDNWQWDSVMEKPWTPRRSKSFATAFNANKNLRSDLQTWAENGNSAHFEQAAIPVCERRRLFLTFNGFLGLGPDCIEPGDMVCVLSGGDVPFILRPLKQHFTNLEKRRQLYAALFPWMTWPNKGVQVGSSMANDSDFDSKYLLVGECYVEGLMQGQAVAASVEGKQMNGPIDSVSITDQILHDVNTPEELSDFAPIVEVERRKRKKARLDAGHIYAAEMLEEYRIVDQGIRWFNIV